MQEFGWTIGRNMRIDYRWSPDVNSISQTRRRIGSARARRHLSQCQPERRGIATRDALHTDRIRGGHRSSGRHVRRKLGAAWQQCYRLQYGEFGMSGKWLELLKEIAPSITQVGILHDAQNPSSIPQFAAMQSLAPSLGVELKSLPLRDVGEIDRIVGAFARGSNLGLIATRIGAAISQRDLIIALAARHRLPAVYPLRFFVTGGGLVSYGPDIVDQYRRAAVYVDRILKGEKPGDLPVQAPTKYELVINLKTAKALGLDVPSTLLARADEVIE